MREVPQHPEQRGHEEEQYSKENPDHVLLRPGDAISIDKIEGQHYPKNEGERTGSPLYVEWRGRIVYFTGIREGNVITVLKSGDKGYSKHSKTADQE